MLAFYFGTKFYRYVVPTVVILSILTWRTNFSRAKGVPTMHGLRWRSNTPHSRIHMSFNMKFLYHGFQMEHLSLLSYAWLFHSSRAYIVLGFGEIINGLLGSLCCLVEWNTNNTPCIFVEYEIYLFHFGHLYDPLPKLHSLIVLLVHCLIVLLLYMIKFKSIKSLGKHPNLIVYQWQIIFEDFGEIVALLNCDHWVSYYT